MSRQRRMSLQRRPSELVRRVRRSKGSATLPMHHRVGNTLDSLISIVAPGLGEKRKAVRQIASLKSEMRDELKSRAFKQINSSDPTRSERAAYENVSIHALLASNLSQAQSHSVTEYGQNSIAHGAVESRVAYEIGPGLNLQPQVRVTQGISEERAEDINHALADNIDNWSEHGVDKSRTMSFPQAQRLAVRNFANYGEDFVLCGTAPYNGDLDTALEFFTPERCETPPNLLHDPLVRLGVQYAPSGIVTGYWMRDSIPNDDKEFDYTHTFYPRFDENGQPRMIHLFEPLFSGQSRGIPWLMANFRKMSDLDDFVEAEIIAKQVEACFGLIFKIDDSGSGKNIEEMAADAASEVTTDGSLMEEIAPGFIQRIGADDEVTTVDPQRPGSNFAPFVELGQRMISGGASLPYEILTKNFSRVTFASGRMAILDGQMSFRMRQSTFIDRWQKPVYRRATYDRVFLDELGGRIPRREFMERKSDFTRHSWRGQPMGLINPKDEINAYSMAHDEDIMSLSDIHAERGTSYEAMNQRKIEEGMRTVDRNLRIEQYEIEQREKLGLPPIQAEQDQGEPDREQKPVAPNGAEE